MFDATSTAKKREKFSIIPAPNPGNVVAYECVQKAAVRTSLDDNWDFQEAVPIRRDALYAQSASRLGVQNTVDQLRRKSGEEDRETNSYTWEIENVSAIEVEPHMPPWRVIAGQMGVKVFSIGHERYQMQRIRGKTSHSGTRASQPIAASPRRKSSRRSRSSPPTRHQRTQRSEPSPISCSARFATSPSRSASADSSRILPPLFSSTSTAIVRTKPRS